MQAQEPLGADTGKKRTPRYDYSLKEHIAFWLFLQLIFLVIWADGFWEGGPLWFSFAWCVYGLFTYLWMDILDGFNEAGAKKERGNMAHLKCIHCGAAYAYPEASFDSSDNSVECQNCAKRFQVDTWKGIQNY